MNPPRTGRGLPLAVIVTALLAFPAGIVLASHQFSDVPTTNPFHTDIDALVDAGVTAGCGDGKFCPSANVTREQMAAFMNRLGALGPGKAPVVNADRVDGRHANGLTRVAGDSGNVNLINITATEPTYQVAADIVVNAPSAGFVLVNASVAAHTAGTSCSGHDCGVFVDIRHANSGAVSPYVVVDVHGEVSPNDTASATYVFRVSAGNNTFQLRVARATASATPQYFSPQITGLFSPFGSTGGSTLEVSDTPVGPEGQRGGH